MSSGRAIAVIVLAIIVATPSRASAEATGIVVVTGKATAHQRAVVETAIVGAVRRASWSLSAQRFTPQEIDAITKCLRDDRPWGCLSPVMAPKGVDRIVVVDANPQPGAPDKLGITGDLVVAGDGAAAVGQQRCDECDDAGLAAAAQRLIDAVLHDMAVRNEQTVLEVHTPPGATVSLDGQLLGITNGSGVITQATYAGPHKLMVQRTGYVFDERTVNLFAGKTTTLAIELQPERTQPPRSSRLVPLAFVGVGVAGMVGGGVLIYVGQQDGPDDKRRYTRATALGVVSGIAGLVAVGIGVCSLRNRPQSSGLIMTAIPGGAVVGWAGAF